MQDAVSWLATLPGESVDLLITDYLSGWTDGLFALRAAKALPVYVPVLLLTARGSEAIAVAAMKEGLDEYLVKDRGDWRPLGVAVRQLIERVALRRTTLSPRQERDRFFSLCPDLLCITDLEGRIRQINRAWEEVLGYRIADLEPLRSLDLVHPDDRERSANEIKKLFRGIEIESFENRCRLA
jgi:PAS domain-containing protein